MSFRESRPAEAEAVVVEVKLVDPAVERLSYRRPKPAPTAADTPFRGVPRATLAAVVLGPAVEPAEPVRPAAGRHVYKLLQYGGYHIKLRMRDGAAGPRGWDRLHVTFELFPEDPRCPTVHFDELGIRIAAHDGDPVNAEYGKLHAGRHGRPTFGELIRRAEAHVAEFVRAEAQARLDLDRTPETDPAPPPTVAAPPRVAPTIHRTVRAMFDDQQRQAAALAPRQARRAARDRAPLWHVGVLAFLSGTILTAGVMMALCALGLL